MSKADLRWKMAKYFYENVGDPDFDALCRTFRISAIEARKLAFAFALSQPPLTGPLLKD